MGPIVPSDLVRADIAASFPQCRRRPLIPRELGSNTSWPIFPDLRGRGRLLILNHVSRQEKILVVDDEEDIRDFVSLGLRHEGFTVSTAHDGKSALHAVDQFHPDIVICDLAMPGMDGWELCRRLAGDKRRGIIILSARDEVTDRIEGLELGADDYLVKPFDFGELLARIEAVLRRRVPRASGMVRAGNLLVDKTARTAQIDGTFLKLSSREFELLLLLAEHTGAVVPRQRLLDEVWGHTFFGDENNLEVYIRYLRQKLAGDNTLTISTVRKTGYRLDIASPREPS